MLSEEECRRIGEAIRAAERRSGADIVCVLARSSSDYSAVPVLWAALIALTAPWPLIAFTGWSVTRIFAVQILVFMACTVVMSAAPLRMALVPRAVRRARAHRAAVEQFHTRGLARTQSRRGVLVYVSMEERYVRILADAGISEKVPDARWRPVIEALVGKLRSGAVAEGIEEAVAACGNLMAGLFPAGGAGNELPDRIYLV